MQGKKIWRMPCCMSQATWPWASLAGKHTVWEGMTPSPRSKIFLEEKGETSTAKPSSEKSVCQKG